jgi:hypothetical protein
MVTVHKKNSLKQVCRGSQLGIAAPGNLTYMERFLRGTGLRYTTSPKGSSFRCDRYTVTLVAIVLLISVVFVGEYVLWAGVPATIAKTIKFCRKTGA